MLTKKDFSKTLYLLKRVIECNILCCLQPSNAPTQTRINCLQIITKEVFEKPMILSSKDYTANCRPVEEKEEKKKKKKQHTHTRTTTTPS